MKKQKKRTDPPITTEDKKKLIRREARRYARKVFAENNPGYKAKKKQSGRTPTQSL